MSANDDIEKASDGELVKRVGTGSDQRSPLPGQRDMATVLAEMLRRAKDATISLEKTTKHLADESTRLTKRIGWATVVVTLAGLVLACVQICVALKR